MKSTNLLIFIGIISCLLCFTCSNSIESCEFCGCSEENDGECKGWIGEDKMMEKGRGWNGALEMMVDRSMGRCLNEKKEKCHSDKKNNVWIICPSSSSFCGADGGRKWTCCSHGNQCNSTVTDEVPKCISTSIRSKSKVKVEKVKERVDVMDFIYVKHIKRQDVPCNCPPQLNCCGIQCYTDTAYRCFNRSAGGVQLCPTGTLLCGDDCYKPSLFLCINEKILEIQNGTSSDSSLSGGAIAGIVIGGLVFLVLLIGLTIFLVLYYKSKQNKREGFDSMLLNDMKVGEVIGRGFFGEVYKGTWNGTTVALKTIKKEGTDDDGRKWREEIVLLHELNHPNIVRLLGIYLTSEKMFMVVEYMENGALDAYLRKKKNQDRLSNNDLLLMGFDIAKGMMYLQSKGVIHRDLAARNLLVDSSLHVKISDFGMSRHGSIYQATSREIPYRWAAPEVFTKNESLPASDVWSFAVCLWEIFSLGATPYEGIANKEVARRVVEEGLRLERVPRCSQETYDMMLDCWKLNPEERPDFKDIYERMMLANTDVLSSHEDRGYKQQFGILTPTTARANSKKKYLGIPPTSTVIPSPKIATSHFIRTEEPSASSLPPNNQPVNTEERKRESIESPRVEETTEDENVNYENSDGTKPPPSM